MPRDGSMGVFGTLRRPVMTELTHFDDQGASRMVDVGAKPITQRSARATAVVRMRPETLTRIQDRGFSKGDVLEVARLAGIMAAKQTPQLIPLCHPLPLTGVTIDFSFPDAAAVKISAEVRVTSQTGVEMEALTAAAISGLTIYDMCKSIDRDMSLETVRLEAKSGGRSGDYTRSAEPSDS